MGMFDRTLSKFFGLLSIALCACSLACTKQNFAVPVESREFGQAVQYTKLVDILWVIDTSTSMSKHQKLMADQAHLFVDALNQTGLDYQMAVTTMDMSGTGARGRFLAAAGTPIVLDSKTPNLTATLETRLKVGDNGSPTERGLDSMKAALTEPLKSGANAGFLRENSFLVVIFLSDENDTVSVTMDYQAWLDELRPKLASGDRSWIAHFMGVTPDDPSCKTSVWNFSSPGYRYIELATASSGVVSSICDADLRSALTNVKARVLEVTTEYPLGRTPAESTIAVAVDGVLVPRGEVDGWTYYAPNKSIRFHGTAVPKNGARIHVEFDPYAPIE